MRLITSALICSVTDAAILVLVWNGGLQGTILFLAAAAAELLLGAWIAFGKHGVWLNMALLFCVTALLSGVFQIVPIRNIGLFCLIGAMLLPVLIGGMTALFRKKQTQKWIYNVKLCQNEEERRFSAFMDTGNRLRLYGSRLPVILVDEMYLTEWIKAAQKSTPQKLVFLPYKGVGGKGILHGIRLQCVLTPEDGKMLSGEVAAVAAEHRLFHGCDYQVILQPEVFSMCCVQDAQEGEKYVV